MLLHELSVAGRTPALPINLEVAGHSLQLTELLRVLPGQRYVGVAQWQCRTVLAKVLVGKKAIRHYQRELNGAQLLANSTLKTPTLLAHGELAGQGCWLLFDYLTDAQSLWQAWQLVAEQPLLSEAQHMVLAQALSTLAQMHAQGLWQADLHLDNLLSARDQVWVIDGGGIEVQVLGQPLSRDKVLANLGVFFAQLPTGLEPHLEELLVHYLLSNGEHALPLEALLQEVVKVRRWRLRDYLRKVGRDCSLFAAKVSAFGLQVVKRSESARLQPLLDNIDAEIERGHLYKTGGAATVARIEWQGQPLVIKRYNIKNWLHGLKRFWRPSRAWHSWREGHRLQLLGITTPVPLAVVERRFCGLRGRAYLVTDYCGAQDIIARFQPYLQARPPEAELLALEALFAGLIRERISHGDFKGHNVFWDDAQGVWSLIDLDAMQQHRCARSFARAYARDRARFMRNWPKTSALHQLLEQRLPQLP